MKGRRTLSISELHSGSVLCERIPETQMDWERIRMSKVRCEGCRFFEWWSGGCKLAKLPTSCDSNKEVL